MQLVRDLTAQAFDERAPAIEERPGPRDLVTAVPAVTNLFPRTYGPVVDGYVFPDQPRKLLAAGSAAHIPVIIGNNLEESAGWVDGVARITDDDTYATAVERLFGQSARAQILNQYPSAQFSSPREAFLRATTDAMFTCATRRVANAIVTGGGGPVFRYHFTYRNEASEPVGHSTEMPYLFQSWTNYKPGNRDRAVSDQMIRLWTRMAKTGNPVGDDASGWRPVRRQDSSYMELNASFMLKQREADAKCGFWDSVALPSPHL